LSLTILSCQRYLYKDYDEARIKNLYQQSLIATSNVQSERIADDLLSPVLDSSKLIWKNISGKHYLLTVMWKKAADTVYYKNNETTNTYNTRNRYSFVTLVPELKDLCSKKSFGVKEGVNLRLEQALGLPEKSGKEYFIEAWVQPDDLIRPCRDIEITDRHCGLIEKDTTHADYNSWLKWLNTNNAGYPFTQLGYTYDWNERNKTHEGLSEFLIDKQREIVIEDFVETKEYCKIKSVKGGELLFKK
jgi:hypothetical protein